MRNISVRSHVVARIYELNDGMMSLL